MVKLVRQSGDLDKARRLLGLEQARRGCDSAVPEILVVGAYPHYRPGASGCFDCWLGVFLSEAWGDCDVACFGAGYKPRRFDFQAQYGSYGYRMGGEQDGDHHLDPVNVRDLESAWRDAGNAVQWQPEALSDFGTARRRLRYGDLRNCSTVEQIKTGENLTPKDGSE